jgi:hypothetical protein
MKNSEVSPQLRRTVLQLVITFFLGDKNFKNLTNIGSAYSVTSDLCLIRQQIY